MSTTKRLPASLLALLLAGSMAACATGGETGPSASAPKQPSGSPASEQGAATESSAASDEPYVFRVVTEQAPEVPESEAHIIQMGLDAYIADGHPNFSYEFETCEQNELASRLAILIASNDVPDMFNYEDGTALDAIIELDAVVNIDKDFPKIGLTIQDICSQGVIDAKRSLSNYEGIYSMPAQLTTNGIFYNKEIFARHSLEVPKTWAELETLCDTLLAAGIQPISSNGADGWGITRWIMLYANRLEGNDCHKLASRNLDGWSFRHASFLEAAGKCQEMYQKGYMGAGYNAMSTTEQYATFFSGDAAMIYTGSWFAVSILDPSSNPLGEDAIGYFTPPGIEGSKISLDYALGLDDMSCANAICIGKSKFDEGTNNEFIKFLFENIGTYQREVGLLSPYQSKMEEKYSTIQQLLMDHLETQSKYPTLWFEAKMDAGTQDAAQYNAQLLAEGSMTPEDYCEALAASVDKNFPV